MISVSEAYSLVCQHFIFSGETSVGFTKHALKADREYPPFDRSTMDGICVRWQAYAEGFREFQLIGTCSAGEPIKELKENNQAYEIMTGAVLPWGADLVVPYEDLKLHEGKALITNDVARKIFENVHRKGSDCAQGDVILETGHFMHGPRWGIASSFGYSDVQLECQPRVKIISTGNEIVPVDQAPDVHQIRGSNTVALAASLKQYGFTDIECSHIPDDLEKLKDQYLKDSQNYDWLIYTGGVSKGTYDFLPDMWKQFGVTCYFHGVDQRPGKPLWFGRDHQRGTIVTGLPGNPISSLVCLHRYFLPQKTLFVRISKEFHFSKPLTYFLPVKLRSGEDGILWADPLPPKNSGEFIALAQSDGFIELPANEDFFSLDKAYRAFTWRPFL